LPYLNELSNHFRGGFGAPSIVHICGDVRNFGDALSQISAEAISVDTIVGIAKLKEMARGKITMGNVSTYLLEKGDPRGVMKSGQRCVAKGVDILAPACGISPKTPVANILSLSLAAGKGHE
ncbi:MAG: methylcobamide--CoM methyltransferase, partial [Nitrospinae bacterium]|nr:methylcobamide--CoM methyltransferase [Nitrospinota bacterium]